jgi:hypothetical protein
MSKAIAAEPSVSKGAEESGAVFIFCTVGLAVSLIALLVTPEWVFQPQVIASVLSLE